MRENHISIDIYLDGRLYGARFWPAVPRQGELIELKKLESETGKGGDEWAKYNVDTVIWGNEGSGISTPRVALLVSAT